MRKYPFSQSEYQATTQKSLKTRPWHRFGRNRFLTGFEKLNRIRLSWDTSGLIIRSILAESWTSFDHLLVWLHCSIWDRTYQIERQYYLDLLQPRERWSPGSSDHNKGDRQGGFPRYWIFRRKSRMLNINGLIRIKPVPNLMKPTYNNCPIVKP